MDWLFLRGLSREQRHWGGFVDVFQRALPGARVHMLDLPGTGTERGRASPLDVPGIVADLRARHRDLRAAHPGPWGLFAMSLGGMVAMEWCAAHPADFTRLVLANTSASDVGKPWDRMRPRALLTTLRVMLTRDPVERERLVLSMVTRRLADVDPVARRWAAIQAEHPVTRANVLRQLGAATRYCAPVRLDVPVLVVAGGGDALADPAASRALAARFGARLDVHPEAGHELCLDAPEWLAERIAAWATDAARGPS